MYTRPPARLHERTNAHMHVCMHPRMHARMHERTHACTVGEAGSAVRRPLWCLGALHTCMRARTHARMHARTHAHACTTRVDWKEGMPHTVAHSKHTCNRMYARMHAQLYGCAQVRTPACAHARTHARMHRHARVHARTGTHARAHAHSEARPHAHTHKHTDTHPYARVYVCMNTHERMHIPTCACVDYRGMCRQYVHNFLQEEVSHLACERASVRACVRACVRSHTYAQTHTRMHARLRMHMHTHARMHAHAHAHVRTDARICIDVWIRAHTQGLREQERFELEVMPFWTFVRLVFYNPAIWRRPQKYIF